MQVSFNPNYSNQHFGAMRADALAKNSLRVRVETDMDWFAIDDFVASQARNLVAQVGLSGSPETTRLSGWVAAGGKIEQYVEKCGSKPGSPVPFIKFLCSRADDLKRLHRSEEANPVAVLKKL